MSYSLSVVMIVKNEAKNLMISLPALKDLADEIIILDSGSIDNSQEIAQAYGAKWFVNTNWQGFGKQRQLAQSYAKGDWILALDADEEITPQLKQSILDVIKDKPENTVYALTHLDFIFGHQIDNRYWRLKAYRRLYPNYFSFNDLPVHESLDTKDATIKNLRGFVHHHTAHTPSFWLTKRLEYAKTWAEDSYQKGKTIKFYRVILHTFWAFIKHYLINGRFLQGKYGFVYATLFTEYTFNKYLLLWLKLNEKICD